MRIITEIQGHHLDEWPIARDRRAYTNDFPNNHPSEKKQPGAIRDRLVEELLSIMTGEEEKTGIFRKIALELAERLMIPHSNPPGASDTLLQPARVTTALQQVQDKTVREGGGSNNATFRANEKLIKDTEKHYAKELRSSAVGLCIAEELTASTDRIPFTAYLASIKIGPNQ